MELGDQVTVGNGLEAGDYELAVVVKKSVVFTVAAAASNLSTPTFSPAAGTYYSAQSISISTTTPLGDQREDEPGDLAEEI